MPPKNPTVTTAPAPATPEQTAIAPAAQTINPFELPLGDPFALSLDCELLDREEGAVLPAGAGTLATVKCKCGSLWRANLLSDDPKQCPECGTQYTHVLAIVPLEDRSALREIVQQILIANGLIQEPDDAEDLDEDEDEDDQDEDDEQTDDEDEDDDDDDEQTEKP